MWGKYACWAALFYSVVNIQLTLAEETTATPGVSISHQEGANPSLLDSLYFNYFAIYHGAPMSNLASSYTLNNRGNPSKMGIYLDSEITTAYMIDSNIGFGPDIPFLLVPVQGQGIILGDVGVKFFDIKTISWKGFRLYTNLILQAPTSKASEANNLSLGVKSTPYFRYNIPGSRFILGAWTEIKSYLGVTTDKDFKLYGAPYVGYQIAPTVALNFEYELEAHHNVGTPTLAFSTYQSDVEPGFVWAITPKILLNPYLQFFTNNKVTMDTMSIGAVISATVL